MEFKTPVVVVISPLLSLMHDQVSKLVVKGVKAVPCISGYSDPDDAYAHIALGTCLGAQTLLLAPKSGVHCVQYLYGFTSRNARVPSGTCNVDVIIKYLQSTC